MKKEESIIYTKPFLATVRKNEQGIKNLVMKSKVWYQHQIDKFNDGENVSLVIHNRKPKRTIQQNSYYWGVYLPLIAEETGEKDLYRLHELFKGKFLTTGIFEVLGEKVRMKKSTTELNKAEFTQFIMDIEVLTGIIAPPTDNWID